MTDAGDRTRQRDALPYAEHPLRAAAVGEVHARPFRPLVTPCVIHHLAFLGEQPADAEHEALARFCRAHGASEPQADARHHVVPLGQAELRWERHTEFTTMSLVVAPPQGGPFVAPRGSSLAAFLPAAPGPLLVATRLALVAGGPAPAVEWFDRSSLCVALCDGGTARVVTDFREDASGFTRILVEDLALEPARAGALAQRLLEIETYRTLALLGLPEAQRIMPAVGRIENDLVALTARMRAPEFGESARDLLDGLTELAAETEAESSAVAYRFAAAHAYEEIMTARLAFIREERVPGFGTIESFLARRMRPAMRTCRSVEKRLSELSRKLARASHLLRARIDVELESQNRDLLDSMNRRARLQLRLQQTVEGLSVAAISYYVVGLIGYFVRGGADAFGWPVDPAHVMAAAVIPVALVIWGLVRRVRRHADGV